MKTMETLSGVQGKRMQPYTVLNCKCSHHNTRARGYKTFFMLNSTEQEILNAHKYKNIKKLSPENAIFPAHKC